MSAKPNKKQVTVLEAKTQDVGRGICRIDKNVMDELQLRAGDVVKIMGQKETAAIVWPGYPEDTNRNVIRLDRMTRINAGVGIDDQVMITPVDVIRLNQVELSPADGVTIANGESYLKNILEGRVLTPGDIIEVPVLNRKLRFGVKSMNPKKAVGIVSDETEIKLLNEKFDESKVDAPASQGIPQVTYEDIGGIGNAIKKVREMIELPLKHPEVFEKLGIEPPKGVLLYGPPGTGKTLLAKAVANESNANFYSIGGPEIMSKFYGESEERLREIFKEAEENAPSIIFIDELDSIAPKRAEVTGEVERRVVAQLLTLLDGLKSRGNVIVIGASNRPNAIDPALRRPGRFDREIEIGVPNQEGRREIFAVHTRGMPLDDDVDLDDLARRSHGFVGADIEAVCKEAAMIALRRVLPEVNLDETTISSEVLEKLKVTKADFEEAMNSVEPSAMREVLVDTPDVSWNDIGGLDTVKQELIETVQWPLSYGEFYKHMGAKPPKGILLYGPPGTGKTLLAKAVAKESEANFIAVKGPEFLSKWVGESERAVRETFRKARQAAPCVVFIDEIDAVASRRGASLASSGVTERVVSQLLTELDGIEELRGVTVIAATNRPDMIDEALLRPGRFDRLIEVPLPDKDSRLQILQIHAKDKPFAKDIDWNKIAEETEGFSGAELAAIVSEAIMLAIREYISQGNIKKETTKTKEKPDLSKYKITKNHILQALERIKAKRSVAKNESTPSLLA